MKWLLKLLICLVFFPYYSLNALTIITSNEIDLKKSEGELKGYVVFDGKTRKDLNALGKYKLSKNKKNVLFIVSHIKRNENYHTLENQPSLIKETKGKLKIKKGTKLILAGELENEISSILGTSKNNYRSYRNNEGSRGASQGNFSYGRGSNNSDGISGSSESGGSAIGGSNNKNDFNNPFPEFPDGNSNSNSGNTSGGYYPPISGGGNGNKNEETLIPIPPNTSGNNASNSGNNNGGNGNNGGNTYSSQYCKSPIRNGNEINLSVIDKDGNCLEMKASRDDTKCQYRYDFEKGKAIKQTQFYYIDKENSTQNIGGCVDLEGSQFQFTLYADDTKCKLQSTDDKGYGGGTAHMFQTQILFRGADGLIHIAKDCSDFANVKEELINYELDHQNKKLIRIVNQYYIDPITGKKVYISNGIQSPYKAIWKEFTCGRWEYNDQALEAYRPTQIRAFDEINSSYYNITGCDYSTDQGKAGKITQKYTKVFVGINSQGEEEGDLNITKEFSIDEAFLQTGTHSINERCCKAGCMCYDCGQYGRNITTYSQVKKKSKWKTQYKTINRGTTEKYLRPKQENDSEEQYNQYKFYFISKANKVIERISLWIEVNEFQLDEEYMKNYEINELTREINFNEEVLSMLNTESYRLWKQENYKEIPRKKCLNYSIEGGVWKPQGSVNRRYCDSTFVPNSSATCTQDVPSNYITPAIKPKP